MSESTKEPKLKKLPNTESFEVNVSKEELIDKAKKIRQSEIMKCAEEIELILNKYNLRLTAEIIVNERGNFPNVVIEEKNN